MSLQLGYLHFFLGNAYHISPGNITCLKLDQWDEVREKIEQEERRQRLKRLKKNYSFLYTTTYFKKVVFRETHEKSILKVATISRLLTASRYLRNYNDPKFSWILIAFNGVLTCVERYLLYRKVLLNIEDYLNWFKSYPQVIPHSRWIGSSSIDWTRSKNIFASAQKLRERRGSQDRIERRKRDPLFC